MNEELKIGKNRLFSVYDRDREEDVGVYIYPNFEVACRELFARLWSPIYSVSTLADRVEIVDVDSCERKTLAELANRYGVKHESNN